MIKDVYAKGLPSIFVVGSPFQAMCAVEAIRDFEIIDYKLYAVLNKNARDNQMLSVLDFFNVDYEKINKYTDIYPYYKRILILIPKNNHYKRAFVGSIRSGLFYYWAMRKISNKSIIVSLDDGADTVVLLRNSKIKKAKSSFSCMNDFLLWITSKMRRIQIKKHLYTIYCDIVNDKYIIYPNTFRHIYPQDKKACQEGIYFAGTNPSSYRKQMRLTEDEYFDTIEFIMTQICNEYRNEIKYYIPHGMDCEEHVCFLCKKYGFKYLRPACTIELFMCSLDKTPIAVLGLGSSSLYNIKKLFPNTFIRNYLLKKDGLINDIYKDISYYYAQNGIVSTIVNINERNTQDMT